MAWRDRRILEMFGIETPILQSPMAGTQASAMAIAVSGAGGLGGLPTAVFGPAQVESEIRAIRAATNKPFNVNFICHTPPHPDAEAQARWIAALKPAYAALVSRHRPPPAERDERRSTMRCAASSKNISRRW